MYHDGDKIDRWTSPDGEFCDNFHASLIPYKYMVLNPPTHTFAIYPTDPLFEWFVDMSLVSPDQLKESARQLGNAHFSEDWVLQHQQIVAEYFPGIAHSEQPLLKVATRVAKRFGLPLACVRFGRTQNLDEPYALLYTHTSFRIDRALARLQELTKQFI